MTKRSLWVGAMLGLTLLAGAAVPDARAQFALRGSVMGNGGNIGANVSTIHYRTAGQAAVGVSAGANFILCHGFWCFGGVRVVDVGDPDPGDLLPASLEFGLPTPNPASGAVVFSLALPEAATVGLAVFDVQGRQVDDVVAGSMDAGFHRLRWDGTGRAIGAGVYFVRLVVDGQPIGQRRVIMLR